MSPITPPEPTPEPPSPSELAAWIKSTMSSTPPPSIITPPPPPVPSPILPPPPPVPSPILPPPRNTGRKKPTQMWCPLCKKISGTKAVSPSKVGADHHHQRVYYSDDHADVQWFRRGRICLSCNGRFLTAEIHEEFVDELVELRNALSQIKINAEAYIKESNSARKSLYKLSESLDVLRALKIYQSEETDDNKPVPDFDDDDELVPDFDDDDEL